MFEKVYIIVLNWNAWKDTIACLESLLKNIYSNYQIVVVDNDSRNNSLEKIKEWANRFIPYIYYEREEAENGGNLDLERKICEKTKNFQFNCPLILIQSGANLGFAGGNNVGLRYALNKKDGKYVLILNNDTIVNKDFLVKLVDFFKNHSRVGVCGPKIIDENGAINRNSARRRPRLLDYIFRLGLGKVLLPHNRYIKRHYYIDEYDYSHPRKVDVISGACMLIKTEVIREIGLLDENTFLYLEEFILHEKLKETKWETWVVPESIIIHAGGKTTALKKRWYINKVGLESLYYYLKYYRKMDTIISYMLVINVAMEMFIEIIMSDFKNLISTNFKKQSLK